MGRNLAHRYHAARFSLLLLAVTIVPSAWYRSAVAQGRYLALFRDGSRATSNTLGYWPLDSDSARFGDRSLFDPLNPARLLVDREVVPRRVGPYVELANGDILPGRVVAHRGEEPDRPGRFVVALEGWLRSGDSNSIEIRAESVARIVGSKSPVLEADGLGVLLIDGRKLAPRSLRWSTSGIRLLTEQGVLDAPFGDLADVVLPNVDRTSAVMADSLLAGKDNSSRILRLTTREGAVLKALRGYRATEYISSRMRGRSRNPPPLKYHYVVQPAWSFDSIAIPEEALSQCGLRRPNEIPLSLLTSQTLSQKSLLGILYPWRRNESLRGAVLASGELASDVGVGAHAFSAIAFELPPGAREFSAWVGLDRAVGDGGCVQCRVLADDLSGRTLWESGFVRGSEEPEQVGPVDVESVERLVLVTDFAHLNRPPGADPLDVRDEAVWLAPIVSIDLSTKRDLSFAHGQVSGLRLWQADDSAWRRIEIESQWTSLTGKWEPALRWQGTQDLKLTRRTEILPGRDLLEFRVAGPLDTNDPQFELLVDGQPVKRFESLERGPVRRNRPRPDTHCSWWDLQSYQGRTVSLELLISGRPESSPLIWRGLSLISVVSNPASGGVPVVPDVLLTSLTPVESVAHSERYAPVADGLPGRGDDPIRFLGRPFTGGFGLVHDSRLSFELRPEYERFVAVVGCCRGWAGPFQVLIDDKVVWEKVACRAIDPAEQVSLEIPKDAKRISIVTGPEGGASGYGAFAAAGFTTKGR